MSPASAPRDTQGAAAGAPRVDASARGDDDDAGGDGDAGDGHDGREERALRVRARARRDGCVNFQGEAGPHGLPRDVLDAGAARVRFALAGAERPGGPRVFARATPRDRIDDVSRYQMLPVLRRAVHQVDHRFDAFPATSSAGMVDGIVGAQATFRSRRPLPYLGRVVETVSVEVRQCPIAYRLESEYGPIPCVGRRVQLLVGPPSGWASAFVQSMVLDQCFQGAAQDIAVRRYWAVPGALRSLPFVSTQQLQAELRYWTVAVLEHLARGLDEQARVRATPYTSARRDDELPALADEVLAVPTSCVEPIAGATRMYYALEGALRQGLEPWNADLDAALDRVRGAFSTEQLAALASLGPRSEDAGFDAAAIRFEGLLRRAITGTAALAGRELEFFERPGVPARTAATVVVAQRIDETDRRAVYRERMRQLSLPPRSDVRLNATVLEPSGGGIALRLCRRERLDLPGDRRTPRVWRVRYSSCSTLRFAPSPHIEHSGWLAEPIEAAHAELGLGRVVRGTAEATGRVEFVRELLGVRGLPECAAFVRPLQWGDEHLPRRDVAPRR